MLSPNSEADLAEIIARRDSPLRIIGGGTRPIGRPINAEPLTTRAISGVELYEPGAMTIVVKAGTPVAEVEQTLAAEGQRLPFEPMDHRRLLVTEGEPTIGAVVAANVSGPRRIQAGACRDFLLGVRFVDGQGQAIKNGGRVMKNVTGYDLVKLMAGSYGTLGVLTELSFKVLAKPEAEVTLVRHGLDANAGVAALSRALGSPFDVTGAAHAGEGVLADRSQTCVRLEGMAGSVEYRSGAMRAILGDGWQPLDRTDSAALWEAVRDVTPFAGREGAVWRVSVKPTDGPVLSARLTAAGVAHRTLFDWGGGLVWLLVDEAGHASAPAIRAVVADLGGHATLIRASETLRDTMNVFQPLATPIAAINAGLRQRFDPKGILNPGLMG